MMASVATSPPRPSHLATTTTTTTQPHDALFSRHFESDPGLLSDVRALIAAHPPAADVLVRTIECLVGADDDGPAAKRRKLADGGGERRTEAGVEGGNGGKNGRTEKEESVYVMKDLSFLVPRKKLDLYVGTTTLYLTSTKKSSTEPSPTTATTTTTEATIAFSDVERAVRIPVPDKPTPTWAVTLFPKHVRGVPAFEPIVFTFPEDGEAGTVFETRKRNGKIVETKIGRGCEAVKKLIVDHVLGGSAAPGAATTSSSSSSSLAASASSSASEKKWDETSVECFQSGTVVVPKRNDIASFTSSWKRNVPYVTALIGAKEGRLFFLPTGLFYGFRKPLIFIPHRDVLDVAVSGITSRTFNLAITFHDRSASKPSGKTTTTTTEKVFEMIDRVEFEPIDKYLRDRRLDEASLRADRKLRSTEDDGDMDVEEESGAVDGDGEDSIMDVVVEEEEDDEDFVPKDDEEDPVEEFESDYETDSGEDGEEEQDEDDDDEDDDDNDNDDEGENENEDDHRLSAKGGKSSSVPKIKETAKSSVGIAGASKTKSVAAASSSSSSKSFPVFASKENAHPNSVTRNDTQNEEKSEPNVEDEDDEEEDADEDSASEDIEDTDGDDDDEEDEEEEEADADEDETVVVVEDDDDDDADDREDRPEEDEDNDERSRHVNPSRASPKDAIEIDEDGGDEAEEEGDEGEEEEESIVQAGDEEAEEEAEEIEEDHDGLETDRNPGSAPSTRPTSSPPPSSSSYSSRTSRPAPSGSSQDNDEDEDGSVDADEVVDVDDEDGEEGTEGIQEDDDNDGEEEEDVLMD